MISRESWLVVVVAYILLFVIGKIMRFTGASSYKAPSRGLVNSGIYVAPASRGIKGWGVYAARSFKKGEIVEECPVIFATDLDNPQINDYVFGHDDKTTILTLGYGAVYNHSDTPHLSYHIDEENRLMTYVAKRPIEAGEEIFINYGDDYWTTRDLAKK